jgi:hypothetical protein
MSPHQQNPHDKARIAELERECGRLRAQHEGALEGATEAKWQLQAECERLQGCLADTVEHRDVLIRERDAAIEAMGDPGATDLVGRCQAIMAQRNERQRKRDEARAAVGDKYAEQVFCEKEAECERLRAECERLQVANAGDCPCDPLLVAERRAEKAEKVRMIKVRMIGAYEAYRAQGQTVETGNADDLGPGFGACTSDSGAPERVWCIPWVGRSEWWSGEWYQSPTRDHAIEYIRADVADEWKRRAEKAETEWEAHGKYCWGGATSPLGAAADRVCKLFEPRNLGSENWDGWIGRGSAVDGECAIECEDVTDRNLEYIHAMLRRAVMGDS